jgi:EAL domain-containing protein (putative c-di-GMP-specific phosphodiesterase class I)
MHSDVIKILVFAPGAQIETINAGLQALDGRIRITAIEDADKAAQYLAMGDKWSLVLCSMLVFNLSAFRRALLGAKQELLASVVVLQSPSQNLTVDSICAFGGDDIVSMGNTAQLHAVAQREIRHAQTRRKLVAMQAGVAPRVARTDTRQAPPQRAAATPRGRRGKTPQGVPASRGAQPQQVLRLLKSQAVTLQYQSIATIGTEDAHNALYEVFVRLVDEHGKLLYPNDFFPVARHFKLLPLIDLNVVKQVIALLEADLHSRSAQRLRLFIKLSEETVEDKRYCKEIVNLIAKADIARGALVIELGKGSYSHYPQQISLIHTAMARRGHSLLYDATSMEDCGQMETYSQMIGYLKLNRPLIDGVIGDVEKRTSLTRLIECAANSGLQTIASRIEHADVLPLLYSVGVTHIQGYFVGPAQHEPVIGETGPAPVTYDTAVYLG